MERDMSRSTSAKGTGSTQGLKALASRGFTALKAEPFAKALRVLARQLLLALCRYRRLPCRDPWRAGTKLRPNRSSPMSRRPRRIEAPLALLLRRVFGERLTLERAVRTWASVDPPPVPPCRPSTGGGSAMCESLLAQSGLSAEAARACAQILYWAFLGFALSTSPCRKRGNRPCSTYWLGSPPHNTAVIQYAKDQRVAGDCPMNAPPERLDSTVDPNCWRSWSVR